MSNNYEINYWKLIFATHLATLRLETPDFDHQVSDWSRDKWWGRC